EVGRGWIDCFRGTRWLGRVFTPTTLSKPADRTYRSFAWILIEAVGCGCCCGCDRLWRETSGWWSARDSARDRSARTLRNAVFRVWNSARTLRSPRRLQEGRDDGRTTNRSREVKSKISRKDAK